jgi:hypothetical protein
MRILAILLFLSACTAGQEVGLSQGATHGSAAGAWAGPLGSLIGGAIGAGIGLATARDDYPEQVALTPPARVLHPSGDVPVD